MWVAISSLSSHAINLHLRVLLALGSPVHSAELQLARVQLYFSDISDGNLTAEEMYPDIDEAASMMRIDDIYGTG